MFGLFKKKKDDTVTDETVDVPLETAKSDAEVVPVEDETPLPGPAAEAVVEEPADDDEDERFVPPPGLMHGMQHPGIPGMAYSPVDPNEEFKATAGEPLADGVAIASEEAVVEALQTVYDPEIPINIYELGLIYSLDIGDKGDIKIEMSLTAPGCPVAGEMPIWVQDAVSMVPGVNNVVVNMVFDPPWTPERMSDEARVALDWY